MRRVSLDDHTRVDHRVRADLDVADRCRSWPGSTSVTPAAISSSFFFCLTSSAHFRQLGAAVDAADFLEFSH